MGKFGRANSKTGFDVCILIYSIELYESMQCFQMCVAIACEMTCLMSASYSERLV